MKIKFKCSNPKSNLNKTQSIKLKISLYIYSRQNQANDLLRIQQSSVAREHELAEDFRIKISNLKQEINQIKQTYDNRLGNLNKEHQQTIEKLNEKHQVEIENLRSESKHLFDIENEAQKRFYSQTIEELKREHNYLLSKQMTQNELGQEYSKEKSQLEKQIKILEDQIEQIKTKSHLELIEQKNQFDIKSNEYKQLENEFEQYKLNFKTNTNNLTELNQQVK
jgi:hypothetical protein